MTDDPMIFPILTLFPMDQEEARKGIEDVEWHIDEESFTSVNLDDLKRQPWEAMLVVDAAGRCWRVRRVIDLGAGGSGWGKLFRILVRGYRKVRYELERVPSLPFEEVRRRVSISTKDHWWYWRDEEGIAGESGPPKDEAQMLSDYIRRLEDSEDLHGLIAALERNSAEANGDID